MARKLSVAKFRNKVTPVMIVTDLAARGIDIPMLDNVINYNFPAKSKLFIHRVGEHNQDHNDQRFRIVAFLHCIVFVINDTQAIVQW